MINFDFDYYKPIQLDEAYNLMSELVSQGKTAVYYSGGTELMTSFRKGNIKTDAVIDIKDIVDIKLISTGNDVVTMGACASLNELIDGLNEPFLSDVFIKIADHTVRNAITLGGNICGRLPYKEAILPLIALDATVVIYTSDGLVEQPIKELFDKKLKINKGDIVYQIKYNIKEVTAYSAKRITESTEIDYPIVHVFASLGNDSIFVGLSGYASYPIFNRFSLTDSSVESVYTHFSSKAKTDIKSSKAYREHLLKVALKSISDELEGFDD